MLLQGTDRLHQAALEVRADTHDLTGRLHLGSQLMARADEFIERKSRHLDNDVVKHRLETCVCFLCNGILDLIQCIAESDLRSNLCDRVSCRLGSKCGGTADTRVYLDHAVLEALRVKRILYVAAAGDAELCDDL